MFLRLANKKEKAGPSTAEGKANAATDRKRGVKGNIDLATKRMGKRAETKQKELPRVVGDLRIMKGGKP